MDGLKGYCSYARFKRCTPCGEWKDMSLSKCDICKSKLRTKARNHNQGTKSRLSKFQILVKRY